MCVCMWYYYGREQRILDEIGNLIQEWSTMGENRAFWKRMENSGKEAKCGGMEDSPLEDCGRLQRIVGEDRIVGENRKLRAQGITGKKIL